MHIGPTHASHITYGGCYVVGKKEAKHNSFSQIISNKSQPDLLNDVLGLDVNARGRFYETA
jgi:hypothetical protein